MKKNNIVIGIEGFVGAGKTSICRKLLEYIPNSVLLNGGNLYRSIIYVLLSKGTKLDKLKKKMVNADIKAVMDNLGIEIKIEDRETQFYFEGNRLCEEALQSAKSSMAVSTLGGETDNTNLFVFSRKLVDNLKIDYNVIISGRAIMQIYPDIDYHFFITASLEERVKRKSMQYNNLIDFEELKLQIIKRDELQKQAGFYDLSPNTISIDVTNCRTIEESTKAVLKNIRTIYE